MSTTEGIDKNNNNDEVEVNDGSQSLEEQNEDDDTDVAANYQSVLQRVQDASSQLDYKVRLVAVSKTKPIYMIQKAYTAGCRHFGENYVQELIDKVQQQHLRISASNDIQWHFIGSLQSNKCMSLVKCMASHDLNRFVVETIGSEKLAKKLNNTVMKVNTDGKRLKVFVQVNTSGEGTKSGVEPGLECVALCRYIVKECSGLDLRGLMTIGAPDDVQCFTTLSQCREDVATSFKNDGGIRLLGSDTMELSMGMSGDFETAIAAGSTNVRVGSTIFGNRIYATEPVYHDEES